MRPESLPEQCWICGAEAAEDVLTESHRIPICDHCRERYDRAKEIFLKEIEMGLDDPKGNA